MKREAISFNDTEIVPGDKFQLFETEHQLEVLDFLKTNTNVYVTVRINEEEPFIITAASLVYQIIQSGIKVQPQPKYLVKSRFIHNFNNDTIKIFSVSPFPVEEEYIYFVAIQSEDGHVTYTNVEESYLDNLATLSPEGLPEIPEVPETAQLPEIHYYIKPPADFQAEP